MRKLRRNKKYEEFYESTLTMRERVKARGLEEKSWMIEEQIQGDPSSVSVCRRSCQDVLIVCEEFSSVSLLSATCGNKAPLLSSLSSGYCNPPHLQRSTSSSFTDVLDCLVPSSLR